MEKITIQTQKSKEVVDITEQVEELVNGEGSGIVHVHVLHTTAAISTADLDPGTDQDMLDALYKTIPAHGEGVEYRHPHNPEHTPDHILATLIGPGVSIPVEQGKLLLGTWQRIVLFEFDGPRERSLTSNFSNIAQ